MVHQESPTKKGNKTERETGGGGGENKKDSESVKGKKHVLTKPNVFSNKTLTSL